MLIFQQPCRLSELLPYDPSVKVRSRLRDGLKEYLLLLASTELAMQALQQGKFEKFDPIVGENACQIRAVKLALILATHKSDVTSLLEKITQQKCKVQRLLDNIHPLIEKQLSLKHLMTSEELDIKINYMELFLIQSYLLSFVKVSRPFKSQSPLTKNECTDSKRLKQISVVGSMFADRLVDYLRERLSASSVAFVQELVKQWPTDNSCVQMVSEKYCITHNGLKCLPCFWTMRALMQEIINHSIPVVMVAEQKAKDRNYETIKKTTIFFKATLNGYKKACKHSFEPNTPGVIFFGSTCRNYQDLPDTDIWVKELLKYNLTDLVLAYAATHRQYPDKDHIIDGVKDHDYENYQLKANEWGCCSENPSRFFVSHIFCDAISNIEPLI